MMQTDRTDHLSHDEQLRAVVDPSDLPAFRRRHLDCCPACRQAVGRIEQRYHCLGQTAAVLAPVSEHPFRLPQRSRKLFGLSRKPLWAMGMIGVLLFMTIVWWPESFAPDPRSSPAMVQEKLDDRLLMAKVNALIENALPEPYRQLAVVPEPKLELDEDLINWIVPSIEVDQSLT